MGTAAAETVGAVPYFNSSTIEQFSSRGPVTHYFAPVNGVAAAFAYTTHYKALELGPVAVVSPIGAGYAVVGVAPARKGATPGGGPAEAGKKGSKKNIKITMILK